MPVRPVAARGFRAPSIPALPPVGTVPAIADVRPALPYLRVAEAARYLAVSVSTLNKLRCAGGGPQYYRVGRAVLYRRGDLDSWVERSVRRSTSEVVS